MSQDFGGRSLSDLDRAMEAQVRNQDSNGFASKPRPSAPGQAMPDYVEHGEGVPEIGKLTAEAVVYEYENAAKSIETMGVELLERVRHCEAITREALAANDELKKIAARYRDEGKRVFSQIESCSVLTAEVSKTCADLKEKIGEPSTADWTKSTRRPIRPMVTTR